MEQFASTVDYGGGRRKFEARARIEIASQQYR
jgi:hypothetical protein